MSYRVLYATGGTGGHIYPAVAAAQLLHERFPGSQQHFAGGNLLANRFIAGTPFPFEEIPCGAFSSKNPLNFLLSSLAVAQGFRKSCQLLCRTAPELVVAFGSYHTFPLLLAACYKGIPYILHEANAVPGRVNSLLSRRSAVTATFFPAAAAYLSGSVELAKMPLRWCAARDKVEKSAALAYFGLDPSRKTVLLFGGSQGARALNSLFAKIPADLWAPFSSAFQILHFTGDVAAVAALEQGYRSAAVSAAVKPFEARMDLAWQAADLAVCRAGASTIAEALEFSVPTILIPFPHAKDDHQSKNAAFVSEQLSGGVLLPENQTSPEVIINLLRSLLLDDPDLFNKMRKNLQNHKNEISSRPDLAGIVVQLINRQRTI